MSTKRAPPEDEHQDRMAAFIVGMTDSNLLRLRMVTEIVIAQLDKAHRLDQSEETLVQVAIAMAFREFAKQQKELIWEAAGALQAEGYPHDHKLVAALYDMVKE